MEKVEYRAVINDNDIKSELDFVHGNLFPELRRGSTSIFEDRQGRPKEVTTEEMIEKYTVLYWTIRK